MDRPTRLTVVEQIVCQTAVSSPLAVSNQHARWLDSAEQPYFRPAYAFHPGGLDTGWLADPGLLVLKNVGDTEVLLAVSRIVLPAGESCRFRHDGPIRFLNDGRVDLYAFPR